MRLHRARMTLPGGDLRLEALEPPAGDRLEAKPLRDRHGRLVRRRDQGQPRVTHLCEVEADRPEAQPPRVAPAYGVLAVCLAVDAALDANAAGTARSHGFPLAWDHEPRWQTGVPIRRSARSSTSPTPPSRRRTPLIGAVISSPWLSVPPTRRRKATRQRQEPPSGSRTPGQAHATRVEHRQAADERSPHAGGRVGSHTPGVRRRASFRRARPQSGRDPRRQHHC
jgi:hypothetical protein